MLARDKHSSLFGLSSEDEEKSFIKLATGVNIIKKLFISLSPTDRQNEQECLSWHWVVYHETTQDPN